MGSVLARLPLCMLPFCACLPVLFVCLLVRALLWHFVLERRIKSAVDQGCPVQHLAIAYYIRKYQLYVPSSGLRKLGKRNGSLPHAIERCPGNQGQNVVASVGCT